MLVFKFSHTAAVPGLGSLMIILNAHHAASAQLVFGLSVGSTPIMFTIQLCSSCGAEPPGGELVDYNVERLLILADDELVTGPNLLAGFGLATVESNMSCADCMVGKFARLEKSGRP